MHKNLTDSGYFKIEQNINFIVIPSISICVTSAKKIMLNIEVKEDKKSCSGRPKTCKFVNNRKSKISTIPIFFSHIESKKKEKKTKFSVFKKITL